MLFISGRAIGAKGHLVVEMGTLSGASSRCLAAGLTSGRANRHGRGLPAVFMAFDDFSLFPKRAMRAADFAEVKPPLWFAHSQAHKQQRPYDTTVWRDIMVAPVYRGPALSFPGDIVKQSAKALSAVPAEVPIELWSIDSAKSHPHFISQASAVWPRLRAGSIVHLMDFAKHQLVFWLMEFVFRGDVSIAFISPSGAPWSFVVERAPLDWSRVVRWCEPGYVDSTLPLSQQTKILDTASGFFDRVGLPRESEMRKAATTRFGRLVATWNHTRECS